ncbi:hypothetical protein D0O09_31840 [Pseudomonas putida]|nr:hypothetical protein D0O09_31840 [Pseudomonas putida]
MPCRFQHRLEAVQLQASFKRAMAVFGASAHVHRLGGEPDGVDANHCNSFSKKNSRRRRRWPLTKSFARMFGFFKANAEGLGMRSNAEHLRVQRDERWLKRHGFFLICATESILWTSFGI